MGLWGRIQVNGALQRLGKSIAANPYLWQVASDGRPHFDHWVEERASDGDLIRAAAELTSFLYQIPPRYMAREWGQQLATIIQGSTECVRREMVRRGLAESDADQQTDRPATSTQGAESMSPEAPDPDEARQPIVDVFREALKRQQKKFAGQVHSETDERSVRLTALLDATFELYKSQVPGMDVALKEPSNHRNMAQNLTVEYMPLLMLDPDELPRTFAEYTLWKFGNEEATEQIVDVEYLREAFQRGIALLPDETREATISGKNRFEWGKLL